jgi:amino acid adenylation domain-containing protein/thioester reductase-like protein
VNMPHPDTIDQLCQILSEVAGFAPEELPRNQNVLELGISSLVLVDVFRLIEERMDIRPSIRRVFNEFDTIDRLAGYLDELIATRPETPAPLPILRQARQDGAVLSLHPSLRHLAFLAGYSASSATAFNESVVLRLIGPLEVDVLEEALESVRRRHDALRARLRADGQLGIGRPEEPFVLSVLTPTAGAAHLLAELCAHHFTVDSPMLQANLVSLAQDDHLLVLVSHALVSDRIVLQRVVGEIAALYSEAIGGEPAELPEPVPLSRCFEALTRMQGRSAENLAYWKALHEDQAALSDLPTDRPRPAVKNYDGARVSLPLTGSLTDTLRQWARGHGASSSMAVLAVFSALLDRLTGGGGETIGLLGRYNLAHLTGSQVVAGLVNPLPLRLPPASEASLGDWLEHIRDTVADAFDHQEVAFADLVSQLDPARDRSRSALFTVGFEVLAEAEPPDLIDLSAQWVTPPVPGCRYDLHLTLVESSRGLSIQCDYSTELLDRDTVVSWLKRLRSLLGRAADLDATLVRDIALLEPEEQDSLLVTWNGRTDSPPTAALHDLVGAQVHQTPDHIAMRSGGQSTTYDTLWQRSGSIAAALQQRGVQHGDKIGLSLPRTPDLIAAVLGILRAGAAWVPITPGQPRSRISTILEDAGITLTIATEETAAGLPPQAPRLRLDAPLGAAAPSPVAVSASDLAYIYFTSGSTGRPKGVAVEHGNLAALLDAMDWLPQSALSGVLMSTSIAFDISLFELFVPLTRGGTLILAEDLLHLPVLPERDEVTLICVVPSVLGSLIATHTLPDSIQVLMLGGEAVRDDALLPALHAMLPDAAIYNAYGPTEDAVYSMIAPLPPSAHPRTLGLPVRHTHVLVLDAHGHIVPPGANGELLLGGAGISRGYVGRPQLTAERFIPAPDGVGRLYRTGDVVRVMADGQIRYIGRADNQIKLRGHRIELDGVEAVIRQQPGITDAVVDLKTVSGSEHLVAYVCGPVEGLREAVSDGLPAYAVPTWFVALDALPRLVSGKVSRSALPLPAAEEHTIAAAAPRSTTEQLLADIWCQELDLPQIGVSDDFFLLGGTSLRMTAIMLRIWKTFQVRPRLRAFFDHPTLGDFATHLEQLRSRTDQREPVREQRAEARFAWLVQDAELDWADTPQTPLAEGSPRHIFMTGATGFVGIHILKDLLASPEVTAYCLVRGADEPTCRARLMASFAAYGLSEGIDGDRIVVIPGSLGAPRLGMSEEDYERLAQTIDTVYHGAAQVNFIYPYHALRAVNVEGTRAVVRFAFRRQRKAIHYVSTAAIWPMGGHRRYAATDPIDHNIDLNMGYDESKWVAEKMLAVAADRGLPVSIYRPGEVAGHSETGQSEEGHFLFAMFKGCLQIGAFPRLTNLLDLSPVDYVAGSIAYLMLNEPPGQTFHTTNPDPMTIPELYSWMRHIGYDFEVLGFEEWQRLLLSQTDLRSNALYPYASLIGEFEEQNMELPQYDCSRTLAALSGTDITCAAVAPPLLNRYIDYLISIGFLEPR